MMCKDIPKNINQEKSSQGIGRPRLLSTESAVKAYSEHGSINKAAAALGFSYGTIRARLVEAGVVKRQGRPTVGESAMTQSQRNKKRRRKAQD